MNRIHNTAVVGPGVELGNNNVVGPYAVILGPTFIGDDNFIAPSVVIGAPSEMKGAPHVAAWDGELEGNGIHIGDRNVIREQVSIQAPTVAETRIGNDCYMMAKAHLPHDGVLEDDVIVACAVLIAGHTRIGSGANLGLGAVLHQHLVVGPGAMVGMGSVVTRSIPPFATAFGNPARVRGLNEFGMRQMGLSEDLIAAVAVAYEAGDSAPDLERWPELREAFDWYHRQARD